MRTIKVLIAETNEIFAIGLKTVLAKHPDMAVVGICSDGQDCIRKALQHNPNIVFLDDRISDPDYIEVVKAIKKSSAQTKIVVFVTEEKYKDNPFLIFNAQASTYLDRRLDSTSIIHLINRVIEGDFFLPPLQSKRLVEQINNPETYKKNGQNYSLTRREKEVLQYITQGLTYREIATNLFVTENTIKAHSKHILRKMNLRNRHQLMMTLINKHYSE